MNGLLEILTNKKWMMHPESLQALRMVIQQNLTGHVALEHFSKQQAYRVCQVLNGSSVEIVRMDGHSEDSPLGEQDGAVEIQSFVAILPVCGPITRNGDACSYGSVDLRNAVMKAVDEDECKGIIFYINSSGGSAAAIADYKYAINYAHERGKRCIAFVDGMCASAAMYLAALCDERYYMNEQDQVGSIGTMAAFYTEKDGEKNQYTNETYHELYSDASYEKNKWHRDAADGNYEDLLADLNSTNEQFMADVKAGCPNVKDEHLHGRLFDAKDIDGILMDGKSTLEEVINGLIALSSDQSLEPTEEGCKPKNNAQASTPLSSDQSLDNTNNTNTIINMENYPLINAACGLNAGEMVVTEEGTHMDASLLDAIEAKLNAGEQAVADAEQKATSAETSLAELQGKFDELSAKITAAEEAQAVAEKALADANEAHSTELASKSEEISNLNAKIEEGAHALTSAQEDLKGAKDALATAEQALADKDAQIASLTSESGEEPAAGDAPENNGEGTKVQTLREFNPSQYKTNAERKAAFEAFKRGE